jgi:hypothetical protein
MPLYFFHTQTDTRVTDDEGIELSGPKEARRQAITTVGTMMAHAPDGFWGSRPWVVTVTDAVGLVLWDIQVDGTASPAAPV